MTTEQAIYQLTDLIKDRESFMVGDYDKSIYDRDKSEHHGENESGYSP